VEDTTTLEQVEHLILPERKEGILFEVDQSADVPSIVRASIFPEWIKDVFCCYILFFLQSALLCVK
jgi:hypothetical protein